MARRDLDFLATSQRLSDDYRRVSKRTPGPPLLGPPSSDTLHCLETRSRSSRDSRGDGPGGFWSEFRDSFLGGPWRGVRAGRRVLSWGPSPPRTRWPEKIRASLARTMTSNEKVSTVLSQGRQGMALLLLLLLSLPARLLQILNLHNPAHNPLPETVDPSLRRSLRAPRVPGTVVRGDHRIAGLA